MSEHLDVAVYKTSVLVVVEHLQHRLLGAVGLCRPRPCRYHPDVVVEIVSSCAYILQQIVICLFYIDRWLEI